MTCNTCGQPKHPATDCISTLQAELQRKELVLGQLYEACKAGRDWIWNNVNIANLRRSPTLTQLELAIERAEEESSA